MKILRLVPKVANFPRDEALCAEKLQLQTNSILIDDPTVWIPYAGLAFSETLPGDPLAFLYHATEKEIEQNFLDGEYGLASITK